MTFSNENEGRANRRSLTDHARSDHDIHTAVESDRHDRSFTWQVPPGDLFRYHDLLRGDLDHLSFRRVWSRGIPYFKASIEMDCDLRGLTGMACLALAIF